VNFTVPQDIRSIPLTTSQGTTTTLSAYAGKPVMIADFLSECTDICPLISANTASLGRALSADGLGSGVALLEISVDPQRDTAKRLAAYRKLYADAPPNWQLLRASPANTAKLWKYFHVEYNRAKEDKPAAVDWLTGKKLTYDVDHSDVVIFLDGQQHERFVLQGAPDVQGHLPPAKLVRFLNGEGVSALYKPSVGDDWTVDQALSVFSWLTNRHLTLPS
jgi:protein SCO1/2